MTQVGLFLGYQGKVAIDGEGIGRFTVRLADGLLRDNADVRVHVATNPWNISEVNKIFLDLVSRYPGRLMVYSSDTNDTNQSLTWINQHVPVDAWIVPYVGMESAQKLTKPYIVCLHDLVYLHFPKLYYPSYRTVFEQLDRVVRAVVAKASYVVFSSQFTLEHEGMQFLKLPATKTALIRLAAPTEEYESFFVMNESEFRAKYALLGDYVVFPSAIRLHKNHDRLIQAFINYRLSPAGKASTLHLVFTDRYLHSPMHAKILSVLNSCRDLNVRNSVLFLGRIPTADLPSLYRYATGTIVPTLFEGSCPFQILESLRMGTPVAFSNLDVAREVLADTSPFITFNPLSLSQMQVALHRLSHANATLVMQQQSAVQPVLLRTWSDVAQAYLVVVQQVCKQTTS